MNILGIWWGVENQLGINEILDLVLYFLVTFKAIFMDIHVK